MGAYITKAIQAYLRLFWYNRAYFNIFRHNQAYSGIIQAYSDLLKTLCNHGMLRTITYLEPEAYSKPWQRFTANGYNHLPKSQLLP